MAGPLNIYSQPPLPRPPDPAILAAAEQRYCQRLKDRYPADAPFYIPLAGETTEQDLGPLEAAAPRSAHRGQKRALAEYCEWIQTGQELKRVKRK